MMQQNDFSDEFVNIWSMAIHEAYKLGYDIISAEFLLYNLIDDVHVKVLLDKAGVNVEQLEQELQLHLEENQDEYRFAPGDENAELTTDPHFKNIIMRAAQAVAGSRKVDGIDVLMAFYAEDCPAQKILNAHLTRLEALPFIEELENQGIRPAAHTGRERNTLPAPSTPAQQGDKPSSSEIENIYPELPKELDEYCTDLMAKAEEGKIDPVIGRKAELERTGQILSRRQKNNPIFVGEPGVGKTAIVEGLALAIQRGEVPDHLKNDYVITLDLGALVAGTSLRGQFEERLKKVLDAVREYQEKLVQFYEDTHTPEDLSKTIRPPKLHVFIDEAHTLLGAGSAQGSLDAANLLKPALARGDINCIGATTYDEYRKYIEKDKALARRFQKIDVKEPTIEETLEILKGRQPYFEQYHGVKYSDEALEQAVKLAARHIHDNHLPDSAIDVIDEAAAIHRNQRRDADKEIGVEDIEEVIAKMARIPASRVNENDTEKLRTLASDMKAEIFGQDEAVDKVADAIQLARSGLRDPKKPIGSFLFEGPTGVGKTELTVQLAEKLGLELIRFDMSEYMEKHTVSRLIGAPPGYVGFDQEGELTGAVNKHPHSIILLDEIEKAHPDIYNILLQVMDYGQLTDNNGKKADFRNVMVIMTTNAGAAEKEKPSIGFGSDEKAPENKTKNPALTKLFTPEFRNRLDDIVTFQSLGEKEISQIVDKFVKELEDRLSEKNIKISLDDKARQWLAQKGYDPQMGARPMERVIKEFVSKPLSKELLFGEMKNGGTINIMFNEKSAGTGKKAAQQPPLTFSFNTASEAAKTDQKPAKAKKSTKSPKP